MAQNEPQLKETPPGPSPNSPSLLFEYQCRSGKFIRLANRIESKKMDSVAKIESNRIETFLPELECSTAAMQFFLLIFIRGLRGPYMARASSATAQVATR